MKIHLGLGAAILFGISFVQGQPAWFNGFPMSPPPSQIPTIIARGQHTVALRTDGKVISTTGGTEAWSNVIAIGDYDWYLEHAAIPNAGSPS